MIRLLLKSILIFTLTFTAFSLAARVLGSTQPPNPALEGFTVGCEGKPQPCWYGIMPGVTTVEEAKQMLIAKGYPFLINGHFNNPMELGRCHVRIYSDTNILQYAHITNCVNKLGNVIAFLGWPTSITTDCYTWVNFGEVILRLPESETLISPKSNADFFNLFESTTYSPVNISGDYTTRWVGFASVNHYRSLVRDLERMGCGG